MRKKRGGEKAEKKSQECCLEILLSAHVDKKTGMGKFVCLFSRIIKEISVRSSLGRKRRDDRRYQ